MRKYIMSIIFILQFCVIYNIFAGDYQIQVQPKDNDARDVQQYVQSWTRKNYIGTNVIYVNTFQQTAQDVTNATWTKVATDLHLEDTCECWSETLYRFTAPSTGLYGFNGSVNFQALPGTDRILCEITVNADENGPGGTLTTGHNYRGMDTSSGAFSSQGCTASTLVLLEAGDYVEFWVYQSTGGTEPTYGDASIYFQGARIR